jgi:hypothetical protein
MSARSLDGYPMEISIVRLMLIRVPRSCMRLSRSAPQVERRPHLETKRAPFHNCPLRTRVTLPCSACARQPAHRALDRHGRPFARNAECGTPVVTSAASPFPGRRLHWTMKTVWPRRAGSSGGTLESSTSCGQRCKGSAPHGVWSQMGCRSDSSVGTGVR